MDDLEVERRLALRLFRGAPIRVSLDGEQRCKRWQAELRGECLQVADGHVVDLRQQDRLAGAVETRVAERLQVVVAQHVDRLDSAWPDGIAARAPVVVEPAHAIRHGGEHRWQLRLVERGIERRAVGKPVAFDVDVKQGRRRRRGPVGGNHARGRLPGGMEAGYGKRCDSTAYQRLIRAKARGVIGRRDRLSRGQDCRKLVRMSHLQAEAECDGGRLAGRTEAGGMRDRDRQSRRRLRYELSGGLLR